MNTTSSDNSHYYSKIQYFFWLMSGAEINILKECPTDYNRQAGIGFTVFMTTILAFCSGSYAGYYFGESYTVGVIFGIIWAALIFSIDRSMIVTLKKDPTKKNSKKAIAATFATRALLSLLIAFVISIPLELLIFNENIDLHMDKYKLDRVYDVQEAAKRNESIKDKKDGLNLDSSIYNGLDATLTKGEPQGDTYYNKLKADINRRQQQYHEIKNRFNRAQNATDRAYNAVPENGGLKDHTSNEWMIYVAKSLVRNKIRRELSEFDQSGLNKLINKRNEYLSNWISETKSKLKETESKIEQRNIAIDKGLASADSSKRIFSEKIKNKKGFVLRYMILEDLATTNDSQNKEGKTIWFLLWFIRILFFVIEILPTVAKLATPIGSYDHAIYAKEKNFEHELEQRSVEYLIQQKALREIEYEGQQKQTKERIKIEGNLHRELINEIAEAQNQVARQKIEDFKRQHISNKA